MSDDHKGKDRRRQLALRNSYHEET